jgi:PAS domain S-box-containing protein
MWIYDLETLRFLEVNEAAVKHYGYPRAEFLRMRISDILPKEDVARLKAHVQTKRLRPQNSGEGRHLKKDGTIIYVDIISHKLIYKEHKAALIVVNDVTEYKQTRSALKESQAEFSDIIATAMDAITIIDERQRIVVFNPAAEKMFQRSAAQVIGEPLSLVIPDRFRKSHQGYVAEFGKSGATTRSAAHLGQFIGLRADGSEFPIEISISSVESSGQRRYTAIVRDISERVRAEETLRESEERLRSLYQITSKLAAQSDVSTLLKMISDDVAALLDVPGGVVHLYDSQRSEMEAVASTDSNIPVGMQPLRLGEGMTGRIVESHESMIIDDYKTWAGATAQYKDQPFYSVLGVPMLYGGELIGVLVAHGLHATASTKERNHKFTEQDVRLLSLFASAAAGAVYSARLLKSERKRRQEAETLQKATAALTSSLNLEQILNSLLDGLAQIVPFTSSAVLIDEGDQVRVVAGSGFADSEKAIGRLFPRKTSLIAEITRIHRPLIKKDVQADPGFGNWTSQVIRGWMGVPLIVRDKLIGYLTLDSDKPDFYNETHADMAMAFANQAAATLENARLFENSLQSTRRWATLHAASQELARISENLEQVYASIHNAASKLFPIEVFTIALLDDKRTSIDAVYLYDRGERSLAMNIPLEKGFSGRVIESGVSIKIDDDLESHPGEVDSVTFGSLDLTRSVLAVPLRVGDQVIGAMSVQSYEPNVYNSEDLLLLELLATQAAIAIENTHLFEDSRRNAQEFKALVETTRDISTQQNNESLLQMIVERATELLHSSVGGFYSYDAEHEELVSTFSTGIILQVGTRLKLGEGAMGRVALTRAPILIDDYQNWEGRSPRFENIPFRAVLGVPVLFGGELMGVLEVREYGESKRTFTQNDATLLSLFAAHVGSVLHNARLFDRLEERVEQFSTLHTIDLVIGSTTDLRVSLQVVLESIVRLLKVDAASILFYNPGTLNLEYAGGVGFHLDLTHAAVGLGDGLAGRAAVTRQIIDVPELSNAELPPPFRQMIEHEGFISYRGLSLIAKGEVKGVLELYRRSPFPSNPEWNDLLNLLTGQAAIAMDNAMLFNDLEHTSTELELAYDATIEGWAQALELRDHTTGGHTRRILETTITLAYKMGIPDSEISDVRRGVLLHDIGKMGVPDHILLKSSPLTDEEWQIMSQHPLNAYNLLSKISYLRSALDIPYCHHEKWDGSGYPRGLKGEQIPLSARMFSVVDVYDALSYDRPYRSAWPKEKIIEYIKEQSGKHFDPHVVEAFLEII